MADAERAPGHPAPLHVLTEAGLAPGHARFVVDTLTKHGCLRVLPGDWPPCDDTAMVSVDVRVVNVMTADGTNGYATKIANEPSFVEVLGLLTMVEDDVLHRWRSERGT